MCTIVFEYLEKDQLNLISKPYIVHVLLLPNSGGQYFVLPLYVSAGAPAYERERDRARY